MRIIIKLIYMKIATFTPPKRTLIKAEKPLMETGCFQFSRFQTTKGVIYKI